jgi:glycosyltransferase involved in cell wall biosynthesis
LSIVVRVAGRGRVPWELPGARFRAPLEVVKGGRRTMYELAVAIAATGREVELRGAIAKPAFEEICAAAGARPVLDPNPRMPRADDTIIVPEGWPGPLFAPYALGGSRCIMMLLAPPGFAGWPFSDREWEKPDPLTVDPGSVGRPEQFAAIAGMGFELWTHSGGLRDAARAGGVECAWIGSGQPIPFPQPPAKDSDLVLLENNRWASLATGVAEAVGRPTVRIPTADHDTVLRELGRARVLVWPSRVEGHSRVQVEARAMGTVPVALASNRFAEGLGADGGAVTVSVVDEMAPAIESLLGRPDELGRLSKLAKETARSQVDWDAYVGRVDAALSAPAPARPGSDARQAVVAELARWEHRTLRQGARAAARLGGAERAPAARRSRLPWRRGRDSRAEQPRPERLKPPTGRVSSGAPTVYVVGGYKPRGGAYMSYAVGRVAAERFFEGRCRVVSLDGETADHGRWDYPEVFEAVERGEMEAGIGPSDLVIANPSFSRNDFGLRLPARKLMYVQGFGKAVLDGFFDRYVCASRYLAEMVRSQYEIEAPVIPPFIHLDRIPGGPPWRERPAGRVLVMAKTSGDVLLGRLQVLMAERHPNAGFEVEVADELSHPELLDRMSRNRYLLSLSPREGFGLAPLEAMAAGCTVVGFHGGGGLEYMRPGENCEVVAYPALEQVADRLGAVIADEARAERLAAAGREAAGAFGVAAFEERWARLLRDFLGGGPGTLT